MAKEQVDNSEVIEDLLARVSALELRLNCRCADFRMNRDIVHQPWCPSFVAPPRMRDCFNCGSTGQEQNRPIGSGEFEPCHVCGGSGKVPEIWKDGRLVWQE